MTAPNPATPANNDDRERDRDCNLDRNRNRSRNGNGNHRRDRNRNNDGFEPTRHAHKHRPDGTTPEPETDGINEHVRDHRDAYLEGERQARLGEFLKLTALAGAYGDAVARTELQVEERSYVASYDDLFRLNLRSIVADFGIKTNESDAALVNRAHDAHRITTQHVCWLPALRDGGVTMRHARVLLRYANNVPDDRRDEYTRKVLEYAWNATVTQTDTYARKLAADLAAAEFEEAFQHEYARRRVTIDDHDFGMSTIHIDVPTAQGHAIVDLADQQARVLHTEHQTEADEHRQRVRDAAARGEKLSPEDAGFVEDTRTLRQLQTDLVIDTLLTATPQAIVESPTAGAARVTATVSVVIPIMNLINPDASREVATIDGMNPFSMTEARELAANAPCFQRILTDPITGHVLTVDTRKPTVEMRRFLQVRDQTCVFPGCRRAAHRSELDHITPWAAGGKTSVDNQAHLCRQHHILKHQRPWRYRHLGNGIYEWESPLGEIIITRADPIGPRKPVFKPADGLGESSAYDPTTDPAPF
jgi:hypothetical protein